MYITQSQKYYNTTLSKVHYTLYNSKVHQAYTMSHVHYTILHVHYTIAHVHYTIAHVYYTVHNVKCTLHNVKSTLGLHNGKCTLHSVQVLTRKHCFVSYLMQQMMSRIIRMMQRIPSPTPIPIAIFLSPGNERNTFTSFTLFLHYL